MPGQTKALPGTLLQSALRVPLTRQEFSLPASQVSSVVEAVEKGLPRAESILSVVRELYWELFGSGLIGAGPLSAVGPLYQLPMHRQLSDVMNHGE